MWLRYIDIKSKQRRQSLTSVEKDLWEATADQSFNVPQPIYMYLTEMGNVTYGDMETEIQVPELPVAVAANFGGYHAAVLNADNHNIFEEIPCLGIAADAIMAATNPAEETHQDIRIEIPDNTVPTSNLLCYSKNIGPRRLEIRQRLAGQGITPSSFPEYVENTRFNLRYLLSLSDIIGKQETYPVGKVVIPNLSMAGGETQVIKTVPVAGMDDNVAWRNTTVQAILAAMYSSAQMNAAFVFGFQLYKQNGSGATDTAKSERWCCIKATVLPDGVQPWVIPQAWIDNRNERRNLPGKFDRFKAGLKRQDISTSDAVGRMIITNR